MARRKTLPESVRAKLALAERLTVLRRNCTENAVDRRWPGG